MPYEAILSVFTLTLVMAAMLVMTATPAMAQNFTLPSYNPCWPVPSHPDFRGSNFLWSFPAIILAGP